MIFNCYLVALCVLCELCVSVVDWSFATGYNQTATDYHHRVTEHTEDSQSTQDSEEPKFALAMLSPYLSSFLFRQLTYSLQGQGGILHLEVPFLFCEVFAQRLQLLFGNLARCV